MRFDIIETSRKIPGENVSYSEGKKKMHACLRERERIFFGNFLWLHISPKINRSHFQNCLKVQLFVTFIYRFVKALMFAYLFVCLSLCQSNVALKFT